MPKIPEFQSQTRMTTEGPNTLVDAASYGIEDRARAQAYGEQGRMQVQAIKEQGRAQDEMFANERKGQADLYGIANRQAEMQGKNQAKLAELSGEAGKGGVTLGLGLANLGEQFGRIGVHIQHAQDVADVSKAIGKSYLSLGNEAIKAQSDPDYINITDPNTGQTRLRTWQETQAMAIQNTENLKTQLMDGLSDRGKQLFEGHYDRLSASHVVHITGEAQQRQIRAIAADFTSTVDDLTKSVALGQAPISDLDNVFAAAASTGVIRPKEIERLKKEAYNKVDITAGQKMAADNPDMFIANIKDDTFLPTLIGTQRKTLESYAYQEKNRQQTQLWDEVQKGLAKNQFPSQEQISRLSGGHQLTLEHFKKSMNDETDPETRVAFYRRVIDLKVDDNTPANADKLANDILESRGLKPNDKISLYASVRDKQNKSDSIANKQDESAIASMKEVMDKTHYDLFTYAWYNDPKGAAAMPKDLSVLDKNKYIRSFAQPFWDASNKSNVDKSLGKKKGGSFLEQEATGLGGGGQPAGHVQVFRVFNKRLNQYENVTKDQYDMIKGR